MLFCGSRTPRRQRWRHHRAVVAHHRQLPVQPVATRPRLVAETQIHLPVVQPTHKLAYCLRRRWDIAAKFRGWRPGAATATVMASICCSKATVFVDFHMTSSFSRCAHALGVVISTAQGNPRSSRLGEVLQKSVNTQGLGLGALVLPSTRRHDVGRSSSSTTASAWGAERPRPPATCSWCS